MFLSNKWLSVSESQVVLSLKCSDYINGVEADAHVSVYVHASVKETGQKFMQRQTFWIDKPQLELQVKFTSEYLQVKCFEISLYLKFQRKLLISNVDLSLRFAERSAIFIYKFWMEGGCTKLRVVYNYN